MKQLLLLVLTLVAQCHGFALQIPRHGRAYTKKQEKNPSTTSRLQAITDDDSNNNNGNLNRRTLLQQALITTATLTPTSSNAGAAVNYVVPNPPFNRELTWPLGKVAFSLLPLAGGARRATVQQCIVPDKIWTHDQLQGIVNVNVPVRQTVIALEGGGLWIHNPVAPTKQLLKMMHALEESYGPVKHVVLGSVAVEHKATFGPFCQQFPDATVWIQPGQWAFPVDLPVNLLGVTQRGPRLRELPSDTPSTSILFSKFTDPPEWLDEIEYELLGPLEFQSVGAFGETAFFHKSTKTLLVTDTVVSVTSTPPPIIQEDPRAMLFHARDYINDVVEDTPETRAKGWRRMVQFGLVFFPSQIDVVPVGKAIQEAQSIDPSLSNLGNDAVPFNLYPWTWHENNVDLVNFEAISQNGKLFCPPILTKLILDREPTRTLAWVDRVCKRFDFQRVIPSHLNNNIMAGPKEFRAAFDVLKGNRPQRPLAEDLALLQKASDFLTQVGVVAPSQVCDGEPARVQGRFARRKS